MTRAPFERSSGPRHTVLVVDDAPSNVRLLERLLAAEGYEVRTASNGEEALASVAKERPDLVLMDVQMPLCTGIEACARLKADASTRLIPVVLVTGSAERQDRIRAIEAGADDFLMKPIDPPELQARVRSLVRLKRYTDDLDSAAAVIDSLAMTVEARDPYTHGHCQRLADYSETLGQRLGLSPEDLAALRRGAYLHDLGKIAIPDAILLKPGPLTPEEFERIKLHTIVGDQLCGTLRTLERVRPIVRHHHERLDGSGYPDGLRGDAVPLLAQIIGIVDVFDAITTVRPYKPAHSVGMAVAALIDDVRKGWRRQDLVDLFVASPPALAVGGRASV